MKKIIAILLTVALCLGLTACFGEETVVVDCDHEEYEPLIEMIEDGEFEAAHAYLYDMEGVAPEMPETIPEEIEPPMPEEEPAPEPAKPDTSGLLTSVEITTEDNLGNRNSSTEEFWTYDEKGRILETDSVELQEYFGYEMFTFVPHFVLEYGENDVVTKVTVMYHDDIDAILTPEYDEAGNLIHTHIVTNTQEEDVYFTYDANGNRLTGECFEDWDGRVEVSYTYTYDEQNRLIRKVSERDASWDEKVTTEYTYDEAGVLVAAVETWKTEVFGGDTWSNFMEYTYSEDGKLLMIVLTTDQEDSSFAKQEIVYHYG